MLPPKSVHFLAGDNHGETNKGRTLREWLDQKYNTASDDLLECVQDAGTLLFIPDGWAHTTLNLEDSIGIAVEVGPAL
jgi:hypothetical protein